MLTTSFIACGTKFTSFLWPVGFRLVAEWRLESGRIRRPGLVEDTDRGHRHGIATGSELVVGPLVSRGWPEPQRISEAMSIAAIGWKSALMSLLIVWTFAAFGEEMSYRGYLLTRGAEMFGRSKAGYLMAMIAVAIPGFGHYYKGPAGVVDSALRSRPQIRVSFVGQESLGGNPGPWLK